MENRSSRPLAQAVHRCAHKGCAAMLIGIMYLPLAAFAVHLHLFSAGIPGLANLGTSDLAALVTFAALPLVLIRALKSDTEK